MYNSFRVLQANFSDYFPGFLNRTRFVVYKYKTESMVLSSTFSTASSGFTGHCCPRQENRVKSLLFQIFETLQYRRMLCFRGNNPVAPSFVGPGSLLRQLFDSVPRSKINTVIRYTQCSPIVSLAF